MLMSDQLGQTAAADAAGLANRQLGSIIGWISFMFLAVVVVAVDYTIASSVLTALLHYGATRELNWLVTAIVLVIQGIFVATSTTWTERVNNVAVSAELGGMTALAVLLLVVAAIRHQSHPANLFSHGGLPSAGYFSLGSATHAGPWMLGFLLGAFTIVGFESAANLAEQTHDPERVVPRAMWQAVVASGALGFVFLIAVTLAIANPAALAKSSTPIPDVIQHVLGSAVSS